mmetsp:Transcript_42087/g.120798  ORF Transcript_42087/g.120798 Transcript_42087/m.120798 type:complete len:214 (+) Transcript_42087:1043-1684(+)
MPSTAPALALALLLGTSPPWPCRSPPSRGRRAAASSFSAGVPAQRSQQQQQSLRQQPRLARSASAARRDSSRSLTSASLSSSPMASASAASRRQAEMRPCAARSSSGLLASTARDSSTALYRSARRRSRVARWESSGRCVPKTEAHAPCCGASSCRRRCSAPSAAWPICTCGGATSAAAFGGLPLASRAGRAAVAASSGISAWPGPAPTGTGR